MALSLGVSIGERISVGNSIVEVKAIKNPKLMVVTVNGGPDISINDDKKHAVEVLPGVRLCTGLNKNGGAGSRLLFEAPKSIPIHRVGKEREQTEPKAGPHNAEQSKEATGAKALFINGTFEDHLVQILKNQKAQPGQIHYLQPYSASRILILAKSAPTPEKPITLYLSVTTSLNFVSYRARIVDWQDKRKLGDAAIAFLNSQIKKTRPSEEEIYREGQDGRECVNLISIVDLESIEHPFSVSNLTKTSDGEPLKNRELSGGWSAVRECREWLGTMPQSVLDDVEDELAAEVAKSLKDDSALRQQRLATAPKLPVKIQVVSVAYRRNPDVIAEVLSQANGICGECHAPAPFLRTSDDEPYLEVHHRIMLSAGGEDTVANAVALCPNCHRKLHFGRSDNPNALYAGIDLSKPETLLEVGAEGGTLAIVRQWNQHGTWKYRCLRNETTMMDFLPEDEIVNRDDLYEKTPRMDEFEDALIRLDRYPWFRLYPMKVSAEFADLVLLEVEKRGGKEAALEWSERLNAHRFDI